MTRERELPPPLEMTCLNALWEIGEGNVEEVRRMVAQNRPLAYTTVLTLLDRLTRRGAVSRRKEGRGFRYQPTVERDKLRRLALRQFLEYHFDGSAAKLKVFLEVPIPEEEEIASAAAAGAESSQDAVPPSAPETTPEIAPE
ncbi:MAG: BlaI/MecI/CopY family transcriptional regulator [Acidobacteriota bacterium]|nr:BlaI/MecI/CopY family transcriptional regulator [Acidobacteriota bacterium]